MAQIEKRGDLQWQGRVRRKGHPSVSKVFDNRADAEAWAQEVEREIRRGLFIDRRETDTTTLGDALETYLEEVTPLKKSKVRETVRIRYLKSLNISKYSLSSIRSKDIAAFRDMRRKEMKSENTIRLDLALLSSVFETARKDWGLTNTNPVREIKQPTPGKGRTRRLDDGEEALLLDYLPKAMPKTPFIKELFLLAIETGMRQSELLNMAWENIDLQGRSIFLKDTKSGDSRYVPLSLAAVRILSSLPRREDGGRAFKTTQDGLVRGFVKTCKLIQKDHPKSCLNLSWHDLRHEAASRLAEKLEAHEMAKMFGWKTIQMALRYYHPRVADLVRKLG